MMKDHEALRAQLSSIEKRLRTSSKEIQDKTELVTVQVNITFFLHPFSLVATDYFPTILDGNV
jgi:hypothetical protein